MKVAIIGAGNVGTAIATAATGAGHEVVVAATTEDKFEDLTKKLDVETTTSNRDAVRDADAVVLAVPFGGVVGVVEELAADLDGKIVIDATNPLKDDLSGVATDGRSGAELVQAAAPSAK